APGKRSSCEDRPRRAARQQVLPVGPREGAIGRPAWLLRPVIRCSSGLGSKLVVVMRALTLAAVAVGGGLAATPALGRTFFVVQSSGDAWTVMDAQGIERIPGTTFRRAWAVRVQRNILSGNPPQPGYVRTLTEYDCQQNRTRWREFTAFSRAGATLVSKV